MLHFSSPLTWLLIYAELVRIAILSNLHQSCNLAVYLVTLLLYYREQLLGKQASPKQPNIPFCAGACMELAGSCCCQRCSHMREEQGLGHSHSAHRAAKTVLCWFCPCNQWGICPLNTVTVVRPYRCQYTEDKLNLLTDSCCYNILRKSSEMRDFKRINFLNIFMRCYLAPYLKITGYVKVKCPAGESCWRAVCTKINHTH